MSERRKVYSFLSRVRRELNPSVRITVKDVLALLEQAATHSLHDKEYRADVSRVFGNVCIHAQYTYVNECGRARGIFKAVILYAHPVDQSCYNAWKSVTSVLWCG